MTPARKLKSIVTQLKRIKARLIKDRDALRELEDEISELGYIAEDAVDNVSYAVDRLSEQL